MIICGVAGEMEGNEAETWQQQQLATAEVLSMAHWTLEQVKPLAREIRYKH